MGSPSKFDLANGSTLTKQDASELVEPSEKSVGASGCRADPRGGRILPSQARALAIARQRAKTLRRFKKLRKHLKLSKALLVVGVSGPTLWRWRQQFAARGLAGLCPKYFHCGRLSPFKAIRLPAQAVRELEFLQVELETPQAAWRQFAGSPCCPPLVARYVQRHGRAPALLANFARIAPMPARVFISADGRRLFVKLSRQTTLTTKLSVPWKYKLAPAGQPRFPKLVQAKRRWK